MKIARFLGEALRTPWAMDPTAMATYAALLVQDYGRKTGQLAMDDEYAGREREPKAASAGRRVQGAAGISLINIFGTIMQRASDFGPCDGGTGAEDIGAAIDAAMADETVSQILMRFATPGGSVFGIQELGDKIKSASGKKSIVGIADSFSASAGYWLAAQCSELYITPGGQVGSIGVYSAHQDVSKALEEAGIKITFVSAGRFKVEGNPYEPLGAEAAAEMKASVDAYYGMFTKAVAKGRGVPIEQVRSGMGEGRMLMADAALAAGMVDGVMTFNDVVKKMQADARAARKPARTQARAELDMLG